MDAVADSIYHAKIHHSLCKPGITVSLGSLLAVKIIFCLSVVKVACAFKYQPITFFGHNDTRSQRIILVGNTIMQCFQNHPGFIFVYLGCKELIIRENFEPDVANAMQHHGCVKEKGRTEMLVCLFISIKLPC